ncbi:hypothetical protein HII28_10860 [Planctomonas sp. JC2975]|uniref:hypothetical protein n=1 Tax=Planctomonas sp. JC2975 TaxID=2729626 RepID=UPI001474356B|nr:hypothetical protein [Planctomonas sp. JC2975]NNC12375.1 hypothetical protein [Planctomonas sp. JC2975]
MPITARTPKAPAVGSELPSRSVLIGARRLLIVCLFSALGYSALTTASRGGVTDSEGSASPATVVNLSLHPNPFFYAVIAAAFFFAVHRVLTRAADEEAASRMFRRASLVVVLMAIGAIVIADTWFFALPLEGWPNPGTWISPFPFGTVGVSTASPTAS